MLTGLIVYMAASFFTEIVIHYLGFLILNLKVSKPRILLGSLAVDLIVCPIIYFGSSYYHIFPVHSGTIHTGFCRQPGNFRIAAPFLYLLYRPDHTQTESVIFDRSLPEREKTEVDCRGNRNLYCRLLPLSASSVRNREGI